METSHAYWKENGTLWNWKECWEQGCRRRCRECAQLQTLPPSEKTVACKQCNQWFAPGAGGKGRLGALWRDAWNGDGSPSTGANDAARNHAWQEVHFLHNEFTGEAADPQRGIGRVSLQAVCARADGNLIARSAIRQKSL